MEVRKVVMTEQADIDPTSNLRDWPSSAYITSSVQPASDVVVNMMLSNTRYGTAPVGTTFYHRHVHSHHHQLEQIDDFNPAPAHSDHAAEVQTTLGLVSIHLVLRSSGLLIIAFGVACIIGNLTSNVTILHPLIAVFVILSGATFLLMSFGRSTPASRSQVPALR